MNKPVEPAIEAAKAQMQAALEAHKRVNTRRGPPSAAQRKDRLTRCITLLLNHKDELVDAIQADFGTDRKSVV